MSRPERHGATIGTDTLSPRDWIYFIDYASGGTQVSVDQTTGQYGSWFLLASGKKFDQGTSGNVELSNHSTQNNKWVLADAVRWVWSTNQVTQHFITSVTRGATTATLTWRSDSNQVYRLQYKTNLADASWLYVSGDVTATNISASKTDSALGNAPHRFYRVELFQ